MILKADINTCEIIDWHANTGEYNARILQVELCEEMSKCTMAFATFELADGTVYESPITDGKAEIPLFENPQFVKIGAYSADFEGDECKKRYSPTPCHQYINPGSYSGNSEESPLPTPSAIAELTAKIGEMENHTIKPIVNQRQLNAWDLSSGIYIIKNKTLNTTLRLANAKTYPCASGSLIIVGGAYSSVNLPISNSGVFKKNVILVRCVGVTAFEVQSGIVTVNYVKNEDGTVTFTPEFAGGDIENTGNRIDGITKDATNLQYPTAKAVYDYAVAKSNVLNEIQFDANENQFYSAKAINDTLATLAEMLTGLDERLSAIEENPPNSAIQTWFKGKSDVQPSATIEEIEE